VDLLTIYSPPPNTRNLSVNEFCLNRTLLILSRPEKS
jgi:hypothetical protein